MKHKLTRRRFVATAAVAGASVWSAPAVVHALEEGWGDLVGRLVHDGPAPEREKLKVDKDVDCCGKYDIRDEGVMVGPNGGLANVFVYVRSKVAKIHPEAEKAAGPRVTLDNRDCIFIPHCMTIWYPKQEFYVVNSDPIAQNVAFSPLGDKPANFVLAAAPGPNIDATWKFKFKQTVPFKIICNYHPWESAYMLPRDVPYMAVTAADGTFRIANLPARKIEFQFWHERPGYVDTPKWPKGRLEVTIQPGVNDIGEVKLSPKLFAKKPASA